MRKELRVALLGPGGVGKTTVIKHLQTFLNKNNFIVFNDRSIEMVELYQKYQNNMKANAFIMQSYFFKKRLSQRKIIPTGKRVILDRDLIDDFVYPQVHIKLGNFSKCQIQEWKKLENYYLSELKKLPPIDIAIVLKVSIKENIRRIYKRSQASLSRRQESNPKNVVFYKLANKAYANKNSILGKTLSFAKVSYKLNNVDSRKTADEIAWLLKAY